MVSTQNHIREKYPVITHQPQANPRLGEVHQQAILRPPPGSSDLLDGEIIPVIVQVNLHNKRNGVHYPTTTALAFVVQPTPTKEREKKEENPQLP